MKTSVNRQTVDLSAFPELVVIYLGMRVNALAGVKTVLGLGPQIQNAGDQKPEGLLHFENNIIYSVFPFHVRRRAGIGRTSSPWNAGPDLHHIATGGRSSSKAPAAPASGIRPTYGRGHGGDLSDFQRRLAFKSLRLLSPRVVRHSRATRALRAGAEPSQPEGNSEAELY